MRWNAVCTDLVQSFIATIWSRPSPIAMRMPRKLLTLATAALLLTGVALVIPAQAKQRLDGNYQCVQLEFEGQSAPCQSPPLVLNQDGSYEIWGEHGTYEVVQGRWLLLSHSKRRGLGNFINSHDVVFEYRVGGRVCRVTFRRIFEAPPGLRWA